jgi:hypothetical protein
MRQDVEKASAIHLFQGPIEALLRRCKSIKAQRHRFRALSFFTTFSPRTCVFFFYFFLGSAPPLPRTEPLLCTRKLQMRREFEERMDKMKGEVQKIQEEKVHLMGLEQRLRQEFQTQVQAEQMSNEELRIRSFFLLLLRIYSCFCRALSLRETISNL